MNDKEKIKLLEKTLRTLIGWLYRELGEKSTKELLDMMIPFVEADEGDEVKK